MFKKLPLIRSSSLLYPTGTYIPRKEVVVEDTVRATTIRPNQAIRLRARKECIDREGRPRVTGEEWLVKKTGAYLPGAYEEVVDMVNAYVLTEKVMKTHSCNPFTFYPLTILHSEWPKLYEVLFVLSTARNNPTETPSAKVTIFRNTNTQLPLKPFCNFQGVIL